MNGFSYEIGYGGGTYDYQTNTYTDSKGLQYSTQLQPLGSILMNYPDSCYLEGRN